MLNSCILTGNLGADPEVFYSSEGDPVATFNTVLASMALNIRNARFPLKPTLAGLISQIRIRIYTPANLPPERLFNAINAVI